jgi:hypothetical protein
LESYNRLRLRLLTFALDQNQVPLSENTLNANAFGEPQQLHANLDFTIKVNIEDDLVVLNYAITHEKSTVNVIYENTIKVEHMGFPI